MEGLRFDAAGSTRIFVRFSVFFFRFLEFLRVLERFNEGIFDFTFKPIYLIFIESLKKKPESLR